SGSVCLNRAEDLGDDIAGLADDHGVPDEHTLAADLIGVVQRGHFYGGTGDQHGLHHPVGSHPAGAAHIDPDVEELRRHLFRGVLVRDRPTGRSGGGAELPLGGHVVDLDDEPVDLVFVIVAALLHLGDVGDDRIDVIKHLIVGRYRHTPLAKVFILFALTA